jgi:hypothetical protein
VSLLSSKCINVGLWPQGAWESDDSDLLAGADSPGEWQLIDAKTTPSLDATLELFEQWLADAPPPLPLIDLIISSFFIRHLVLSWSHELASEDEWAAMARARIDALWGNAGDFVVRLDTPRFQRSRLVCAMPRASAEKISIIQREHGLKIRTIQSSFVAAFNKIAHRVGPESTLIVVGETGYVTVAAVAGHSWVHIRTLPRPGDLDSMKELISRERLLLGLPTETVVLNGVSLETSRLNSMSTVAA